MIRISREGVYDFPSVLSAKKLMMPHDGIHKQATEKPWLSDLSLCPESAPSSVGEHVEVI